MTSSKLIDDLLSDRTYHIEFNGHLTNHAKHAVVALARLGAAPEAIKRYYDNYAIETPYGFGLEQPRPPRVPISKENWRDFLGQRSHFASYCEFFDGQTEIYGLDSVLREYLPELLPGWVGAFTHATIHLGWGLDIESRWMVIEGLAYMAFAYVSCHPERAEATRGERGDNAVNSLFEIVDQWEKQRLGEWVENFLRQPAEPDGIHPELQRSGLQFRIARILSVGHPLIYQLPAWSFETEPRWDELYYLVTLLYLSQPGDFVILHLITSLHAMEQIADAASPEIRNNVAQCFWIGMLGVIFAERLFVKRSKLQALHKLFHSSVDDVTARHSADDWANIVGRAFEEEEEHNPKLVYVLKRLWERTGGRTIYRAAAGQFTATPDLPPSFEQPATE
ncbi:hypothetical protein DSM25558_4489 [Agrobacterium sp. DSM 25558]|uniref:questin oxidase family protein n=1 Tax=Agrobacterium sp. DSM 25558 TaxID=1907665 RepID=UPI0009726181|nr:questin oxidase family protein [Agrobacterium sp. DSM 25558]SCX28492.1 hypothetical protein DSM25558_4489 [Agrobacterium sp. DSM 25558]